MVEQRSFIFTPHAGVWIETDEGEDISNNSEVTPHAGVWIETLVTHEPNPIVRSHPTRVCGLKLGGIGRGSISCRHTPRGCVD